MAVPVQYANRHVYHFSHIDNLPGLLQNGFLATNHAMFPRRHRSIAAAGIQERRATMVVPCGPGGCVHDYVPLYFGSCSPMLLGVVNAKNVDQYDILYFEFPISLVDRPDAVFTNASANTAAPPQFFSAAGQLDELDWGAIDSRKWSSPDDAHRHRRMAEVLVHGQLPVTSAVRCVVWNDWVKGRVEKIVGGAPFPTIVSGGDRSHWFNNLELKDGSSVVKGPGEIAGIYAAACNYVAENIGKHVTTAAFKNLTALLAGLRADFGCLPHTAELVGLSSANGVHKHTVDVHTKDVVQRLLALPEYASLSERPKKLVEIAAYLHDIGKGPRSRWVNNGGVQKVDPNHPVGAMEMMADILTENVGTVKPSSARTLLKLVCYHDLVGDVLGKGRDEQQIVNVIDDEDELDMLFALGKADATSLVEHWWNQGKADQLYERCRRAI
ncbi:DUF4433 domain-containing protein [Agrobacterium tumefaciens]|uniref:DarT domain-containing protein n=1 Tax=Agrobacterium tumefaciens TaxID=358 RepID=A0A2L2LMG2_AGRTU|nr:DUF4433 domain-containing protein [Agrobacterium tumefaciens]AVH45524.1 hypothetical protein At1D1609_54930 [Agrobacterium tumefaciens]NSY99250.1 DUF4433 domain-containing protein [Agrobacterium tumefaciens]